MTAAFAVQSEMFFSSELFADVQLMPVFQDSKTFADAIPKQPIADILDAYALEKHNQNFSLSGFVHQHFVIRDSLNVQPEPQITETREITKQSIKNQVVNHISRLWDELTREAHAMQDNGLQSSLIALPQQYIVPGGRFQEIYYWDTYFTALGLVLDNKHSLVMDTFKNFQFLINDNGCVPNGTRDYYRGRSQPPVMALLYQLLQDCHQALPEVTTLEFKSEAMASLTQEYQFWMAGSDKLDDSMSTYQRVVRMPDGSILNRYWDNHTGPRPESYKEDLELAESLKIKNREEFYRHIRAACESGWDFSSRWLENPQDMGTIRTCDIVPVDLNCLLYFLEESLAMLHSDSGQEAEAKYYTTAANARKKAIQEYMWNTQTGFYHDYCISESGSTDVMSLAGTVPLYFRLASKTQAELVCSALTNRFLQPGGLLTTLTASPQQWDSPNGWAPLQWFAVIAMENYDFDTEAKSVMHKWIANIELCFSQHPGMMEKYNVQHCGVAAKGGEYHVQEGFGWTNGVTRAFYEKLK